MQYDDLYISKVSFLIKRTYTFKLRLFHAIKYPNSRYQIVLIRNSNYKIFYLSYDKFVILILL